MTHQSRGGLSAAVPDGVTSWLTAASSVFLDAWTSNKSYSLPLWHFSLVVFVFRAPALLTQACQYTGAAALIKDRRLLSVPWRALSALFLMSRNQNPSYCWQDIAALSNTKQAMTSHSARLVWRMALRDWPKFKTESDCSKTCLF